MGFHLQLPANALRPLDLVRLTPAHWRARPIFSCFLLYFHYFLVKAPMVASIGDAGRVFVPMGFVKLLTGVRNDLVACLPLGRR